jgi:Kef-type K+ transport system membrane component KefB
MGDCDMGEDLIIQAVRLIAQLSVILIAAKVGAEICERYLKQPAVIGELLAGVILSPFLFGSGIPFFEGGSLFPPPVESIGIPVPAPLFALAQMGAVILLFLTGLETDLKQFLKYATAATLVAVGGVLLPFVFGAYFTVAFGLANHFYDANALFVGSILTATSVGITARVLGDINKLDTPEGVTILGAAVVDDVLGILVLSIVIALGTAKAGGASINFKEIGIIGLRAVGFWVGLMVVGILTAPLIERTLSWFKTRGTMVALALALCFIASFLAEWAGLAMIIGAYAIGLSLSSRPIARDLIESIEPIYHLVVPVFFVVTGMMVNLKAVGGMPVFALVITAAAIAGKLIGCFFPAIGMGFNFMGASRVGIGMIPRGEVALIVAQVGIAKGIIGEGIYGVSIIMTFVTTLFAPVILSPIFQRGGSGTGIKEAA